MTLQSATRKLRLNLTGNKGDYSMAISDFAKEYHEKMFPGYVSKFLETDPEFIERFDNFTFDEVINMPDIGGKEVDGKTRHIAILATLLGCQGIDEFKAMLPAAMNFGVTPIEIKEITYQAVAYLGIGRVFPFLKAVNEFLESQGIQLPLEGQATTTTETAVKQEHRLRWIFSVRVCRTSGNQVPRKAAISTCGWRIIASEIITPERVLITRREN